METTGEQLTIEEDLLQKSSALCNWLSMENEFSAGFSIIFALFLFILWTLNFKIDLLSWVLLVDLYSIGILVALRKSGYQSFLQESNGTHQITFRRSGIAWKRISDSLLGLALISSIFVYMFSNALPNNPEFASFIYILALILLTLIVPVIPALSKIKSLSILKSKVSIVYDGTKIIEVISDPHPLDFRISEDINFKK
jgi:hypothetical protein